jgi:tetraacyldisaccharide 4'-kinase
MGPEEEWEELRSLKGKKVLALSGIADPDYFSYQLKKCGMEVVEEVVFPDHHFYSARDMALIKEKSQRVDRVVTTEKDMVKLKKLWLDHLPLRALHIEVRIWEEEEFCKKLMQIFLDKKEKKG